MPVVDSKDIRNVALISHSGTGKTSLVEAMLMASGAITRLGNVEDGTTTSDYEPEEIKRKSSIQTSVAPCTVSGRKLNFSGRSGLPRFRGRGSIGSGSRGCRGIAGSGAGPGLRWAPRPRGRCVRPGGFHASSS